MEIGKFILLLIISLLGVEVNCQIRTFDIPRNEFGDFIETIYVPNSPYSFDSFFRMKSDYFAEDSIQFQLRYKQDEFNVTIFLPNNINLNFYKYMRISCDNLFNAHGCDFYFEPDFKVLNEQIEKIDYITPVFKIQNVNSNKSIYLFNEIIFDTFLTIPFSGSYSLNQSYLSSCEHVDSAYIQNILDISSGIWQQSYFAWNLIRQSRYSVREYLDYFWHYDLLEQKLQQCTSGLFFRNEASNYFNSPFDDVVRVYAYKNGFNTKIILDSFWISTALLNRKSFDSVLDTFYNDQLSYTLSDYGTYYGNAKASYYEGNSKISLLYQNRLNGLASFLPLDNVSWCYDGDRYANYSFLYDSWRSEYASGTIFREDRNKLKSLFILTLYDSFDYRQLDLNLLLSSSTELYSINSNLIFLFDHPLIRNRSGVWQFSLNPLYPLCLYQLKYTPVYQDMDSWDRILNMESSENLNSELLHEGRSFSKALQKFFQNRNYRFLNKDYNSPILTLPGELPVSLNANIEQFQLEIQRVVSESNLTDPYLKRYCSQVIPFIASYYYAYFNLEPYSFYVHKNYFRGSALFHLALINSLFKLWKQDSTASLGVNSLLEIFNFCADGFVHYPTPAYKAKNPNICDFFANSQVNWQESDFVVDKFRLEMAIKDLPEMIGWISKQFQSYDQLLKQLIPIVFAEPILIGKYKLFTAPFLY